MPEPIHTSYADRRHHPITDREISFEDPSGDDRRYTLTFRGEVKFGLLATGQFSFKEMGKTGVWHIDPDETIKVVKNRVQTVTTPSDLWDEITKE